jgi:poly-beta-1,6-N-acetyl-D-glucosamine biosynthesis protein PgaD
MNKHDYERYIIYASDNVPVLIRIRDIVITAAAWCIYVYFIRASWPFFIDFMTWAFSGFDELIQYAHLSIMPTIEDYAKVAALIVIIYLSWAFYNLARFRGRQRRKPRMDVIPQDLANMYGFSLEDINEWQKTASMIMHHDGHGHLIDVKVVR